MVFPLQLVEEPKILFFKSLNILTHFNPLEV